MKRIGKRKVVCEQKCFFAGCSFSCDMPCFEVGSDETDARIERIASTLAPIECEVFQIDIFVANSCGGIQCENIH